MATLKTNTLTGTSTAGSIAVTGEGNSTTTNLQQGLIKVWLQYNSDGNSIYDSFNVGSVTDRATGNFTTTFTNNMGNDDYALAGAAGYGYSMCFEDNEGEKSSATASDDIHVVMAVDTSGAVDQTVCSIMLAGDLA
jgi:hypothetical protein|tara:strand:+ start:103 stop:510 length:408 start_codon:yes stop_codon:yes gene_type:complete